jgi:type IV secretory pathway VirJ component
MKGGLTLTRLTIVTIALVALTVAGVVIFAAVDPGAHAADNAVAGLPLVEVPAAAPGHVLAVLVSGDGGWAPGDRGLSQALAKRGVAVVGLNAPRYFAHARTPDESARDLDRVLGYYRSAWGRDSFVVIGYSRGADVVPFMVTRLPDSLRHRVALVPLLGPSRWAGFQFHPIDLIENIHRASDLPVAPEIERLRRIPVLCIYGRRDATTICPRLDPALARPVVRDGGHGLGAGEGRALADTILSALGRRREAASVD